MATQSIYGVSDLSEAIRLICQGKVLLTEDCAASATVKVGSNAIFAAADAVELADDDTAAEAATVQTISSDDTVTLAAAVSGTFTTGQNARIGLASPPVTLGASGFVANGKPRFVVEPAGENKLPALVVWHCYENDAAGGGNRSKHIHHEYRILLAREIAANTDPVALMQVDLAALKNQLAQDRRLGGQAWYSRIAGSTPESRHAGVFADFGGGAVAVGQIDFVAWQFKYLS